MSDEADFVAAALALFGFVAGGLVGTLIAWTHAPPVGGEFWPYIRAGVAVLGFVIGAKAGMILAALGAFVVVAILAGVLWVVDQ